MANKGILQINDILNDYSDEIQEGITKIAKDVAKEDVDALKNVRNTYTIRSGDYNRSWTSTNAHRKNYVSFIVHNKDHYMLTHLLENGHNIVGRNGTIVGHARAFPHIAPIEQKSNETFTRRVEDLIRNGG